MSEEAGRKAGLRLLEHPHHELYDPAMPGELMGLERFLRITLPPSLRGLLLVGSGGVLANGDLLLGTQDPDELGATIHATAQELWGEGMPRNLLPLVDGERFLCLDLSAADAEGECPVVEVDPETFEVLGDLGPLPSFLESLLESGAR